MAGTDVAVRNRNRNVTLEDKRIVFRNFRGLEGMYNREGDRNFAVLLEPDLAERLKNEGWNVKVLPAREEGDEPQAYLSVSVSYKGRPPAVFMVTSGGRNRTQLDEETVGMLDLVEIETVDMVLNPYDWNVNGNTGTKAYLQSLYVVIVEDPLAAKYDAIASVGDERLAIESGISSGPMMVPSTRLDRLIDEGGF